MALQNPLTSTLVVNDNKQPGSALMALPLEVLLSITRNLKTSDYCNVRLVSKYFEEQLSNAFSKEYFTKRQFMISEFSLQALIDISRSRFSSSLTHVIIGLERPSYAQLLYGATPQGEQRNRLILGNTEHECMHFAGRVSTYLSKLLSIVSVAVRSLTKPIATLLYSGQDVEMLTEAFSNLPNLETVAMRDFASRTRFRDSPDDEWKSYGTNTWISKTGSSLEMPRAEGPKVLHQTFLGLLRSLGKAAARPKHFEFILRTIKFQDEAFHLPDYLRRPIVPVLQGIKTIFLDLGPDSIPLSYPDQPKNVYQNYHLRYFLGELPGLEHLRLNFSFLRNRADGGRNFLQWLGESPSQDRQVETTAFRRPPAVVLLNLKQLDIGQIALHEDLLLSILRKFGSSLETFSLHKVTLEKLDPDAEEAKVSLWQAFFKKMSNIKIELKAINMTSLQQTWRKPTYRRNVTFKDSKPPYIRRWAGTNMQSALRDFAAQVQVIWEDGDSSLESDHEGEDIMNSDSEDEGMGDMFVVEEDEESSSQAEDDE